MSVTCPAGHQSESTDYCDTCGMPIAGSGAEGASGAGVGSTATGTSASGGASAPGVAGPAPGPAAQQICPNCSAENPRDALFCEACGYDFTTGTMPRVPEVETTQQPVSSLDLGSPEPLAGTVPVEWVVEVWVDPDWYAVQSSDDPCPSPGLPVVHPLRTTSLLVGRPSSSRHIVPDIDCSADTGVSRRQAQLTTDGRRWWVEDLQSSNGTWVAPASGPLPSDPVPPGQRRELAEDDRVYVGAWTRLVVRRATPEEQAEYA